MTTKTYINRPWNSSFSFKLAPYSNDKLEQVHKLARNFVASLDLGCPYVAHAADYPGLRQADTPRKRYKLWVADWKRIYAEVSAIIRMHKQFRRTVRFALTAEQQQACKQAGGTATQAYLGSLSERHLQRLQETAMVLLNARYNAKLAAAEARRRERKAQDTAQQVAEAQPVQQAA